MSFTEIAVEAGEPRSAFLRATRPPRDAFVVARVLDDGQASRRLRVALAAHGAPSIFAGAPREHRALRPQDEVELTSESASLSSFVLHAPLGDGHHGLGVLGLPVALREAGVEGFLDPIVLREGRARVRVLVPRHLEPGDALRAVQDAQRQLGLTEFRVLRVGPAQPQDHLALVRRMLPPEQEDLLRLAASMGYYDTPKQATLEHIAARVGLSISPVHKRLKAAEETLVGAHVAPTPERAEPERRRARPRPDRVRVDAAQPWEILLRVRSADWGPAGFAASARVPILLAPVSEDRAAGLTRFHLVALAGDDLQAKLLSHLEGRPELAHIQVLSRERTFLAVRVDARGRSGYGMGWWHEVWNGDACLRPVLFEGDEALVRLLVVRPMAETTLRARLEESARAARWSEHELVHARPLGELAAPPPPGEPLTTRQLEVLRVAHALGYYQTPRGCTLEGVAKTLGVSANAIHKNLVLAESKIIGAYLSASF